MKDPQSIQTVGKPMTVLSSMVMTIIESFNLKINLLSEKIILTSLIAFNLSINGDLLSLMDLPIKISSLPLRNASLGSIVDSMICIVPY